MSCHCRAGAMHQFVIAGVVMEMLTGDHRVVTLVAALVVVEIWLALMVVHLSSGDSQGQMMAIWVRCCYLMRSHWWWS